MINDSLKAAVASLPIDERRELMAFMAALQIAEDPSYRLTLTKRIDDKDSANWVTLEELDAKLTKLENEGL